MGIVSKSVEYMFPHRELERYAMLALSMDLLDDETVQMAQTNGKYLKGNPVRWAALDPRQRAFLICHEVLHPALGHNMRQGDRDHDRANVAADAAVNSILHPLVLQGLLCPVEGFYCTPDNIPGAPYTWGQSMEWYYDEIDKYLKAQAEGNEHAGGSGGSGDDGADGLADPTGDPGAGGGGAGVHSGSGDSRPRAGDDIVEYPDEETEGEADWGQRVRETAAGVSAGSLPEWVSDRVRDVSVKGLGNWRQHLWMLARDTMRGGYSHSRPHKRHLWREVIMPARGKVRGLVDLAFYQDVSGSVGDSEHEQWYAELNRMFEQFPTLRAHVTQFDSHLYPTETYVRSDAPIKNYPRKGDGGTAVRQCFEHAFSANVLKPPRAIVVVTDGWIADYPATPPPVPVLWIMTKTTFRKPPFGIVVVMEKVRSRT